jgi:hypothetical protein
LGAFDLTSRFAERSQRTRSVVGGIRLTSLCVVEILVQKLRIALVLDTPR